jgi:hypothetical protein
MLSTDTEKIINRLKEALNARSDGQLATYLGISRQNIGAARKREDVPTGWIYKVAELTGCSMDWLSFGKGPKIRVEYSGEDNQAAGRIASPDSPYGFPDGSETGSPVDSHQDADVSGFGAAVEMLARIYGYGDGELINAVNSNIKAICKAIESRQREKRAAKELEDLKTRLNAIEKKNT